MHSSATPGAPAKAALLTVGHQIDLITEELIAVDVVFSIANCLQWQYSILRADGGAGAIIEQLALPRTPAMNRGFAFVRNCRPRPTRKNSGDRRSSADDRSRPERRLDVNPTELGASGAMGAFSAPNHNMFALARESRGFSQAELARRSALAQGTISKIETGTLVPDEKAVDAIASAVSYPVRFFYAAFDQRSLPVTFYRKRKTMPV